MENQKNAIQEKTKKCGASVAEAMAAIEDLTDEERKELLQALLSKYGMDVARYMMVNQN